MPIAITHKQGCAMFRPGGLDCSCGAHRDALLSSASERFRKSEVHAQALRSDGVLQSVGLNDAHHIPSVWVGLGGMYEDREKIISDPSQFPGADRGRVDWSGIPAAISAEVDVLVTPEMSAAGLEALGGDLCTDHADAAALYRAMRPLERSGAMTVLDHQALEQMRRERDESRGEVAACHGDLTFLREVNERQARVLGDTANREAAFRDEIAALTTEKNALADKLTPFLATAETRPKPPVHNPFREFGGDRRRIGG